MGNKKSHVEGSSTTTSSSSTSSSLPLKRSVKLSKKEETWNAKLRQIRCFEDQINPANGQVYQSAKDVALEFSNENQVFYPEEKNGFSCHVACLSTSWEVYEALSSPKNLCHAEWNMLMLSACIGQDEKLFDYALENGARVDAISHEWSSLYLSNCYWHQQELESPECEDFGVGVIYATLSATLQTRHRSVTAFLRKLVEQHHVDLATLEYKWTGQYRASRSSPYHKKLHVWNALDCLVQLRGEEFQNVYASVSDFEECAELLLRLGAPNEIHEEILKNFVMACAHAMVDESRREDAEKMLKRCTILDNAQCVGKFRFASCAEAVCFYAGNQLQSTEKASAIQNMPYIRETLTLEEVKTFMDKGKKDQLGR